MRRLVITLLKMRNKFLLFILITLISSIAYAEKEIKICAINSLTGDAAGYGTPLLEGMLLAKDVLAEQGVKVNFTTEDDSTDPKKTVSAYNKLRNDNCKFLLGPTWSFLMNAVRPLMEKDNIISIAPQGSSDINGMASSNIFNLMPQRKHKEKVLTKWLSSNKYKNALLLSSYGDWGDAHRKVNIKSLKANNIKIVGEEFYDYNIDIATLRSLFTKYRNKGIDIVFNPGTTNNYVDILKLREQLRMDFALFGTITLREVVDLDLLKEDKYFKDVYFIHRAIMPKGFKERYERKYNKRPFYPSNKGYDAFMVMAEAIKNTDASFNSVKYYLKNSVKYHDGVSSIRLDEKNDMVDTEYFLSNLEDYSRKFK